MPGKSLFWRTSFWIAVRDSFNFTWLHQCAFAPARSPKPANFHRWFQGTPVFALSAACVPTHLYHVPSCPDLTVRGTSRRMPPVTEPSCLSTLSSCGAPLTRISRAVLSLCSEYRAAPRFVMQAVAAEHPCAMQAALPEVLRSAIAWNAKTSQHEAGAFRNMWFP